MNETVCGLGRPRGRTLREIAGLGDPRAEMHPAHRGGRGQSCAHSTAPMVEHGWMPSACSGNSVSFFAVPLAASGIQEMLHQCCLLNRGKRIGFFSDYPLHILYLHSGVPGQKTWTYISSAGSEGLS